MEILSDLQVDLSQTVAGYIHGMLYWYILQITKYKNLCNLEIEIRFKRQGHKLKLANVVLFCNFNFAELKNSNLKV